MTKLTPEKLAELWKCTKIYLIAVVVIILYFAIMFAVSYIPVVGKYLALVVLGAPFGIGVIYQFRETFKDYR